MSRPLKFFDALSTFVSRLTTFALINSVLVISEQTPDVAKIVSEQWRNLTPSERAVWDEKARVDKERFMIEKQLYRGPWKVASPDECKKDPSAPKRPMSSFLSYSNGKRAAVKAQNPHYSNADISKALSKMWKEAPQEERDFHINAKLYSRAPLK